MALVATSVETASSKIDDNILIPIFSGFAGHILLFL
jgi:dolichol kinase